MPIKQLTPNAKYTHAVHLSDIHIRLTKRHEEYRNVFQKLYSDIDKTPQTTAIFVLGDVVNSKIDLSPECVDLAAEFLFNLAEMRPTVLVAGNHDTNLTNRHRMDSLAPVVKALDHKSLFYLKKSGLYGLGNICINNYSVFDSPDKYLKGEEIPEVYRNQFEYFIALFHGQVDGAITNLGFRLANPSVTIDTFKNHDIAMLGDIHLDQNLQSYNEDESKPIIRYCGSLIQQRHDEPLTGHGYSFWNLRERDYSQIDTPNDCGFYTVPLKDGIIDSTLIDLPKKARIRFQLTNTTQSEVKSALTKLRQLTEVVESSYQRMDKDTTITKIITKNGPVEFGDIENRDYQKELLKGYMYNTLKVTDADFFDGILKIHEDVANNVKQDDFARNIRWVPIKFEWDNMFSYGEKNVIDFTKTKDLVGLFAANASGKSSLFSALTFCLFDKCEREYKAANVMNTQKTEFMCKFEFEIDGKRYFIQRIGKADKKGKVKVDVKFWKLDAGAEVDLNGEQRKDTNEIIREYLGSYDDFVLTSLSVQNGKNNASIIDMGDTDRKDLFAQFMGLTVFDRLHTEANERLRERLVLMRAYKNDDYTQKLVDYTNLLEQAEGFYKNMTTELERATQERNGIQDKVVEATKRLIKIDVDLAPLSVIETVLKKAQQIVADYKDKYSTQEAKIKLVAGQLETVELEIKNLESKEVNETVEYYRTLQTKQQELDGRKYKLKISYENDVKIVNRALTLEYDPKCSFCVKNSGKIAADAEEATKRIEQLKIAITDLKTQYDDTEEKLKESKWVLEAYVEYQKLIKERNTLKDSQLQFTTKLAALHKELAKFEDEVKVQEKNIELYIKNKDSVEANIETNKQIEAIKLELSNSDFIIKKMNASILDINSKVSVCKNNIDTINRKIDEIKIVEQEYKLYEAYCKAVSRDGIPFDVITATVPAIESEVNNILGQICDFLASFETDGKNVIPYIVYDDKKWLMSLTSGFEKFALSLAIRVALIYISNLPRPNFLIIDEGFGVLDAENLSQMSSLFSYLKTRFEFVMIVSHLESLRDMVDSHIEITKDNGFSHVNFN